MRIEIAQGNQVEGWGLSLLLHGILLVAMWPVFRHLPTPIHAVPFRWNVTLVESPQQTPAVEPDHDASPTQEFLHTIEARERSPELSAPIFTPPPQQPINEAVETPEESNDPELIAAPTPTDLVRIQQEISAPAPSTTEPARITQEIVSVSPDAVEQTKPTVATTSMPTEPSTHLETPVGRELPTPPAPVATDADMAPFPSRVTSPALPASAPPSTSGEPSESRADYSWLRQAVSRRLEELKRSSRPSLEDAGRLKVLVKAVVSSEGKLMEAEVVKSSGVARIDQEAMSLVQRAFPLRLDYAIDRPQIVMRIPITYARD